MRANFFISAGEVACFTNRVLPAYFFTRLALNALPWPYLPAKARRSAP